MLTFTLWQKTIKQLIADQRAVRALSFQALDTSAAAAQAIELYKHLKTPLDIITSDIQESMSQVKTIIADIMEETNTRNIQAPAGIAYIPAPGESISYDTKALDLLCASDPALAEKIRPFRQVRPRPGALTIR